MGENTPTKGKVRSKGRPRSRTDNTTGRNRRKTRLVDEPMYCGSCGKQYYVSGDKISLGKQKRWVYELEPEEGKETFTMEKNLLCPYCFGELYPLKELEEIFGESIRSF